MKQPQAAGHFHAVQFYRDNRALGHIVAGFLAEGLTNGDAGVLIATPEHTDIIEHELHAMSVDMKDLRRLGQLAVLDARETLQMFMVDGLPDSGTFKQVVGSVLTQVCRTGPDCTIRAYGEMVNLLWQDGLEAAAIRLETLWNELANTHDFKLLCGYSMGNFYKGAAIETIKGTHSHLVDTTGVATAIN